MMTHRAEDGADDAAEVEGREAVARRADVEPGCRSASTAPSWCPCTPTAGRRRTTRTAPACRGGYSGTNSSRDRRAARPPSRARPRTRHRRARRGPAGAAARASSGQRSWWRARKRGDSGSTFSRTAASTSGSDAADEKERAPAEARQDLRRRRSRPAIRRAECTRSSASRRTAGAASARTRTRAPPRWASRRRGRGRRGTAARRASTDAVGERHQERQHAERDHAAEQRDAAAEPIADDAADEAADHHADHAARQHRRERRARQVPLAHERRECAARAPGCRGRRGRWSAPSRRPAASDSRPTRPRRAPRRRQRSSWDLNRDGLCEPFGPLEPAVSASSAPPSPAGRARGSSRRSRAAPSAPAADARRLRRADRRAR